MPPREASRSFGDAKVSEHYFQSGKGKFGGK